MISTPTRRVRRIRARCAPRIQSAPIGEYDPAPRALRQPFHADLGQPECGEEAAAVGEGGGENGGGQDAYFDCYSGPYGRFIVNAAVWYAPTLVVNTMYNLM